MIYHLSLNFTVSLFLKSFFILCREFEIIENIRVVCLLDFTADLRVKINANSRPNCQPHCHSKTGIHSCLCAITLTAIFVQRTCPFLSMMRKAKHAKTKLIKKIYMNSFYKIRPYTRVSEMIWT